MDELFDAAPMYDEDYLYFFAAPSGFSEAAVHGPNLPAQISQVRLPRSWPGGCWTCSLA